MMAAFLPLLGFAPHGDGQPVLVLPGFLCNDATTAPLRRYLSHLGYQAHGWELNRNLGLRTTGSKGGKLLKRLDALHTQSGEKVSVVGWPWRDDGAPNCACASWQSPASDHITLANPRRTLRQ